MSDDDLRAAAEAATPGPWRSRIEGRDHKAGDSVITTSADDLYVTVNSDYHNRWQADQDYIAAANPTVVLELLDRVAALEVENANLHKELTGVHAFARRMAREKSAAESRAARAKNTKDHMTRQAWEEWRKRHEEAADTEAMTERWLAGEGVARERIAELEAALRELADAYEWIAENHPLAVQRHLPLIRAREILARTDAVLGDQPAEGRP